MNEAMFEDFLDLAADRLDRAALVISNGATISAATCAALSTATRSLVALSTRYGLLPNGIPAAAWQPALVDRLVAADRRFRHHARGDAVPSAADALISDAARLVTVAQDLLATHLTSAEPARQFARTPLGEHLLETPVRDHLLRRAATLAEHLSVLTHTVHTFDDLPHRLPHLANAYRPRGKDLAAATRELADAAAQCPMATTARLEMLPAPVLAAAVTYPPSREDPIDAAAQIRDALRRMATAAYRAARALHNGEYPPLHTAGDLRETATHLAAAHTIAAELLTRLSPYLPANLDWNPADAAARLRASGAAWLRLRRTWAQTVSVPDSGPRSPLTVQAVSIAIRLGRLTYDDHAWTPEAGPGRPRDLSELLAPEVLRALCMTVNALPREAALIAANHARLVSGRVLDLYSFDRAHRPETEGRRFFPLQPAQRTELDASYGSAATQSQASATALAHVTRGHQQSTAADPTRPSAQVRGPNPDRTPQQQRQRQRQQSNSNPTPRR